MVTSTSQKGSSFSNKSYMEASRVAHVSTLKTKQTKKYEKSGTFIFRKWKVSCSREGYKKGEKRHRPPLNVTETNTENEKAEKQEAEHNDGNSNKKAICHANSPVTVEMISKSLPRRNFGQFHRLETVIKIYHSSSMEHSTTINNTYITTKVSRLISLARFTGVLNFLLNARWTYPQDAMHSLFAVYSFISIFHKGTAWPGYPLSLHRYNSYSVINHRGRYGREVPNYVCTEWTT